MKKWLKKHGRWLLVGLGIVFITYESYILATEPEDWQIVAAGLVIAFWASIILVVSGAASRIFEWWEKE